jgi:hypothetical protein
VAVSYDVPQNYARKVGATALGITLAAHNLATLTKYGGLDPENSLMTSGGASTAIGIDQAEYPQLTSLVLSFRLSY